MKLLSNLNIRHTFVKYIFSYLLIYVVLLLGFFSILKNQLTNKYFEQLNQKIEVQLEIFSNQFNDDILYLSQVTNSITSNINIILSRYATQGSRNYWAYTELQKYDASSKLIHSIIYKTGGADDVISTNWIVNYSNGLFGLHAGNNSFLTVDTSPYMNANKSQLLCVSDDNTSFLLYLPADCIKEDYTIFYILDADELSSHLKSLSSPDVTALALIDAHGQIVAGVDTQLLAPYVYHFSDQDGFQTIDSSTSLYIQKGLGNTLSLVALISKESLLSQIDTAFSGSYLALILLGVVGLALLIWSLKITYLPLHKLANKIIPPSLSKQSYISGIEQAFSESAKEKQALSNKLNQYQLSMQKMLLDSIVTKNSTNDTVSVSTIDQFFNTASDNEFFVIYMSCRDKAFPYQDVQHFFTEVLPGKDICLIMEANDSNAIFLLNYISNEQNKCEVLKNVLHDFYKDHGYQSVISNSSHSPLDIPSLCANVKAASVHWAQIPVVDYASLPPTPSTLDYPYDTLKQLSDSLKKYEFDTARLLLDNLFQIIDTFVIVQGDLPDFFTKCILLDTITTIADSINQSGIKFTVYSDLYYESLFLCRSHSYFKEQEKIRESIRKLIECYAGSIADRVVTPQQLNAFIEKYYCHPDFSISMLADHFHVSIAYMSYLVKKELEKNFSDLLWNMRLKKAQTLLTDTDMSIDEVSVAVGYLNASSFRRKFKQETGITPSQYRSKENM